MTNSRTLILTTCLVGVFVIGYVLWTEGSARAGAHQRPDALSMIGVGKVSLDHLSPGAKHFMTSRWIPSSAWSSPSGHHLPNLRRMLLSALGLSDFNSNEMQDHLRHVLSIGERGEPRVTSATIYFRYTVDVSAFLRPEHRQRLRLWSSRQSSENTADSKKKRLDMEAGVDAMTKNVVVVKDLPWNAAQSLSICELVPLISGKAVSCSGEARALVQRLHELAGKIPRDGFADNSAVEPLMRMYQSVQLFSERHVLSGATSRQAFIAVFNDGAHFSTSPIGLTQQLCDGSRTGRDLDYEEVKLQAAASRAVWNQHLLETHGSEMFRCISEITESSTSLRGEELLLSKIKIWNPIRASIAREEAGALAAQSARFAEEGKIVGDEAEALEVLFRPSMLCVMMTTFGDGLKLALLQYLLWGDYCDDFVIAVASADANGQEKLRKSFVDLQRTVKIRQDRLIHVRMTSDDVKRNLWMQFQLTIGALDEWIAIDQTFQYVYFATDDTYMIPENLYAMLMQPEWFTLHAANTPLLFGNAMWEPLEKVMYVSSGPGIVLNNVALRLAMTLTPTDACQSKLVSNAWEVLVSKCLASSGVQPRDTTDELGEDRFHVLSLHWMLLAPTLVAEEGADKWWYDEQRPRDGHEAFLKNPFRAVSSSTIAFNKVNTPEKALWMHMQLRHA